MAKRAVDGRLHRLCRRCPYLAVFLRAGTLSTSVLSDCVPGHIIAGSGGVPDGMRLLELVADAFHPQQELTADALWGGKGPC